MKDADNNSNQKSNDKNMAADAKPESKTAGKNVQHVKLATPHQYTEEELVVSSPSQRNWRGIFIALLVIVAVLGLIVFSIVLVSPPQEGPRVRGRKPSLPEIILGTLTPSKFNGTWVSDTEFVYRDVYGGINVYNAENLTTKILMTNSTFRQLNALDFKVSNDLKYVLLLSDITPVYQYTRLAKYNWIEIAGRSPYALSWKEDDQIAPYLQYATWSPEGNAVAFVYKNDIYYKPHVHKSLVCTITNTSDSGGVIFNGIPDWLYEIEILKTGHALWFSPDGTYLLYLSFNDSQVGEYKYPWYQSKDPKVRYPRIKSLRYPKVETPNPNVTVWIVNLATPKYLFPLQVKPTNSVEPGSYLSSVSFFGDHDVAVVWLNRRQNVSVIVTCKAPTFNCIDLHIERAESGWTEPISYPVYSRQGSQCLARLPVRDGEKGNFMHACQLNFNDDRTVKPLTHGLFEVTRILAWDEDNHIIYVMATSEENPGHRHLYKIGDVNSTLPWTCMTCNPQLDINYTASDNVNETLKYNQSMLAHYVCDYNNVIFSNMYRFYIQECLGPDIPVVFLVETNTNIRMAVLEAADSLRSRISTLAVPQLKRFQVEIEDGYKAQVKLYYPPGLREYEDISFPMILIINSKPGSQSVSAKWEVNWPWYLASNRNFIVAQIDARGTGYQGEKMRREIYEKIGSLDVQDQLAVLTYLRDTFRFIDRTRVCAIGTGYGGYIAAMILSQDPNRVINCSVSIAPITHWQFYNSYFTEKYMGYPSERNLDYDRADLTKLAGNINGRNYLLAHGTADTTVKPQHAQMFAKSLIEQGVLFQQLVYPDEDHYFSGGSLVHLYKQIEQFFNESFGPFVFDDWDDGGFFIQ